MTPQQIAEGILGAIRWKDDAHGFCVCPGAAHHTGANKGRDCEVFLVPGEAPSINCFHKSCEAEVGASNFALRSALGRAAFAETRAAGRPMPTLSTTLKRLAPLKPAPKRYALDQSARLPDPIPDGARELIRTAFLPGEFVRIAPGTLSEHDGRETPDGGGITLSREEWLAKLDAKKGDPNGIFFSTKRTGIFISVNPMRPGGTGDKDVTAYRHALVEFDGEISPAGQWELYRQSALPCSAIIFSGGKSVHAWVRVDAATRTEYDDRVAALYEHFAAYTPDAKNKNPSRFSRLPNCVRFGSRQELLSGPVNADRTFAQWLTGKEIESIGRCVTLDALWNRPPDASAALALVGVNGRWLYRGGSLLLSAPSGIGKSILAMQLAFHWAIGRGCFGLAPIRPIRSLFVQAENDDDDLREPLASFVARMGIHPDYTPDEWCALAKNVTFRNDVETSGAPFLNDIANLVSSEKPDVLWIDPIAAFVGEDIGKQTTIASFFRQGLQPILRRHGCAVACVNHVTKPPTDPKARSGWKASDHQYSGAGSYDLPGWARSVVHMREIEPHTFEMIFAKRSKHSGATHPDGTPTDRVLIRHSTRDLFWEQIDPPAGAAPADEKAKPPTIADQVSGMNIASFVADCPADGESLNQIAQRLGKWLRKEHHMDASPITLKGCICRLGTGETEFNRRLIEGTGKLEKGEDNLWRKGKNS